MPEPTRELILKRHEKGQARLSKFFKAFDEAEMYYDCEWEPSGPEGFPKTTPATASAIIEEATDHIDTEHITPHVPTIGRKGQNEQQAGKLKGFIQGTWNYWSSHAEDIPPPRDFTKNLFLGNKAIYRVLIDFDAWPEPEITEGMTRKQKDELMAQMRDIRAMDFPIVCQSISPRWFIDDPTIGRKKWGMEFYSKDVEEVQELYPLWPNPRGPDDALDPDKADVIDYWEEGTKSADSDDVKDGFAEKKGEKIYGCWRVVLADHIEALGPKFLPGYPLPWVVKYGGGGRESRDGHHEKKARGILHPVRSLLRAEGRRLTQLDAITAFYATPVLFAEGEEGEWVFKWEPGWLNFVPPGRALPQAPNIPQPHAALLATIGQIQSGIERGTFGSVVSGEKQPGTRSAAEHAILSAQAELRFRSAKRAVEDGIREVNEKVFLLLRNVLLRDDKDEITVPVTDDTLQAPPTLKKNEIPSPFYHRIELRDMSPSAVSREALVAAQLYQAGIIDLEESMERSGIQNTADMKMRVMRDKVMASPLVVNHLGRDFVEEYTGEPVEQMEFEEMLMQLYKQQGLQSAQQGMGQGQGMNQAAAPMGIGAMQGQVPAMPGSPEETARAAQGMQQIARPQRTPV